VVSKNFRRVVQDPYLWRSLFLRDYGHHFWRDPTKEEEEARDTAKKGEKSDLIQEDDPDLEDVRSQEKTGGMVSSVNLVETSFSSNSFLLHHLLSL